MNSLPKDWPLIRWITLIIVGAGCWWLARESARAVGNLIANLMDAQFILMLGYGFTYFSVMITVFVGLGVPIIVWVEWIFNKLK